LRILIVLGSGGHTAQMLRLVKMLGERFEYSYLISKEDKLSEGKIEIAGDIFYAHRARNHGDNILITTWKVLRLFMESSKILRRSDAAVIISVGPGIAVPISILGKLLRKKVIYIEDISRIYSASTTGKIMHLFADLFFVQWPELQAIYPKAKYAGRLL
jgi:beta-1,4-N-acetylglucosaminyltransferase